MHPNRAAELIAMLVAKVERYEPTSSPTFGALRREDINLALALVSSLPARLLVRIKYADECSNINTLEEAICCQIERGLLSHVEQFAAPQRWKTPRPYFLRDMCRLAICETVSPKLCWQCNGHEGWYNREGKWLPCERCAASGLGSYSHRKRAQIMGVHEAAWKISWAERYHEIQNVLDRIESLGLSGMAKRLSA